MDIEHCQVVDEILRTDPKSDNYIGPQARLTGCTVKLSCSAKRLVIVRATFDHCVIQATRPLIGFRFHRSDFVGCQFVGSFSGCVFGADLEEDRATTNFKACDFSSATLHLSDFRGIDPNEITQPAWPQFALLWPGRAAAAIRRLRWSKCLNLLMLDVMASVSPNVSLAFMDAEQIVAEFGGTVDRVRTEISRLDSSVLRIRNHV